MADKYKPINKGSGKLEIQGLTYVWSSGSAIKETPVQGDKFYNPNTDRMDSLAGQKEYDPINLESILSKVQFIPLRTLYYSSKAQDGTLTATHQVGELVTLLTGVRLNALEYGDFDKSSNSAASVKLTISFSGIGSTEDVQRIQGNENTVVTA
jgi:hypothetical protein